MATENSPQTLFRFVSLRNPNLAETDEKNLRFIFRPSNIEGFFDAITNIENQPKIEALITATSSFPKNAIKSLDDLEAGEFSDLLELGKAISTYNTLSEEQLISSESLYNQLKTQTKSLENLWDNLIYQYLTQNDFYVKEAIVQILKAFHVGYVQTLPLTEELEKINGDDFIGIALSAKVVFPFSIFEQSPKSTGKESARTDSSLSSRENIQLLVHLEKREEIQKLESDLLNLTQLKNELEKTEKNFNINFEKEYNQALSDYQEEYADDILKYEAQLQVIRELEESGASAAEIQRAYELLKTLEVPPFNFTSKNELNWDDLLENLSQESLALFILNYTNASHVIKEPIDYEEAIFNVISDEKLSIDETLISLNYLNFNSVYSDIDLRNSSLNLEILNRSKLPKTEYAKVGKVLVPLSNSKFFAKHHSYIVKANKPSSEILENTNLGYISIQLQVENDSWSVDYAMVKAQTESGSQIENLSNIQVIDNTISFPLLLLNKFKTIEELEVQIFFTNGQEGSINLENLSINEPLIGQLVLQRSKPVDPTTTSVKHFGLKRLGIAEYMKVVQTVHAYVPGEVSDIENVMASELRHKSINELTRTEDTLTTTKTQEIEKISDTTKTNRAEMQTEVAKEIEKQQSFQGYANFSYDSGWKIDLGTSYASNNSQYTSNRQIVSKSQEITERAMERVQSKITEERILKIIREVSLTNVHEFDNRGGLSEERPQHITGVYRWVDKKMKNQIYNYGKRTLFEFMIPEPAQLHRLSQKTQDTLQAPVDPRKAPKPYTMPNANMATNELLEYWASEYGVTLEPLPQSTKTVQRIFNAGNINPPPGPEGNYNFNLNFTLQENYDFMRYDVRFTCNPPHNGRHDWHNMVLGSRLFASGEGNGSQGASYNYTNQTAPSEYRNADFAAYCTGRDIGTFNFDFKLYYQLSQSYILAWKQNAFNLIIQAYEAAYEAYLEEKATLEAEQQAQEGEQKESQANFYRIIEATILKHNCIAYLLQNYLDLSTLGADFTDGNLMENFTVHLNDNLDLYTAKAKFLEQAFEWSIMDYTFYPYYWAARSEWQTMYLSESIDPLFRSFLQAGMARVIVTIKPGFEEAVQYFLTTGKVWMGGETPVIGDPLYVSITQEMQDPVGVPQGKYWITRIPTTLTILQDKSTGLEVTQPLPIFPEPNPENCENPEELETETVFTLDDAQLSASDRETTLPKSVIKP